MELRWGLGAWLSVVALAAIGGCATTREVFVSTPRTASRDDPLACEDAECAFRVASALRVRYQPVDEQGQPVGEGVALDQALMFATGNVPMRVPLAADQIRIEAACQPELTVPASQRHSEPAFATPERKTAYLHAGSVLSPLFVEGDDQAFPENTVVDVFRLWPDDSGGCTRAAVRILDLGGVSLAGRTYEESFELIRGSYFLVPTSQLSERETDGPSLAEQARAQREARAQEHESAEIGAEGAAADEIAQSRCTEARHGAIERALGNVDRRVRGLGQHWHREHREVLVIGPDGAVVPYRPLDDGEHAAIVVSFESPHLTVRRGNAELHAAESSLASVAENRDTAAATFGFSAETGHDYELHLTGRGCAGVLLYRRER